MRLNPANFYAALAGPVLVLASQMISLGWASWLLLIAGIVLFLGGAFDIATGKLTNSNK
jgi:hypothetical protein